VLQVDYETRKAFARRLVELRKARGLTQAELGKRIGRPYTYISRVETARIGPSLPLLMRMANGLEVEVYQFFLDASANLEAPRFLRTGTQEEILLQVFRTLTREDRSLILSTARQMAHLASEREGTSPSEQTRHTQSDSPAGGLNRPADPGEVSDNPTATPPKTASDARTKRLPGRPKSKQSTPARYPAIG